MITEQCSQQTIHWMETVAHHSMIELVSLMPEYDQYQLSDGTNTKEEMDRNQTSIHHSGVALHFVDDLRFQ